MDVKEEETLISLKASPLFKHATPAEFNAVEIPDKANPARALFQLPIRTWSRPSLTSQRGARGWSSFLICPRLLHLQILSVLLYSN